MCGTTTAIILKHHRKTKRGSPNSQYIYYLCHFSSQHILAQVLKDIWVTLLTHRSFIKLSNAPNPVCIRENNVFKNKHLLIMLLIDYSNFLMFFFLYVGAELCKRRCCRTNGRLRAKKCIWACDHFWERSCFGLPFVNSGLRCDPCSPSFQPTWRPHGHCSGAWKSTWTSFRKCAY